MTSTEVLSKGMREAIQRSGYLVEQRLVPLVERFGFKATPNQRFRDPETGELREIDIFAISSAFVSERRFEMIFPILLIAVKTLRCPLVLFTQSETNASSKITCPSRPSAPRHRGKNPFAKDTSPRCTCGGRGGRW
jgi:hypothetical protein